MPVRVSVRQSPRLKLSGATKLSPGAGHELTGSAITIVSKSILLIEEIVEHIMDMYKKDIFFSSFDFPELTNIITAFTVGVCAGVPV